MKKISIVLIFVFFSLNSVFATDIEGPSKASYYHSKFNGRKTATGETYWDYLATAASNIYKLGTKLVVTNLNTGKRVLVKVNDRMAAHIKGRVDLSKSAFEKIGSTGHGLIPVKVEIFNAQKHADLI